MNIDLAKIDFGKSKGSEPVPVIDLGSGTWDDPYTVEGVKAYIDTLTPGAQSPLYVYVKGIVSSIDKKYAETGNYGNAEFYISDDGDGNDFQCWRLKYFYDYKYDEVNTVSEKYDIAVGDKVIIYGKVMLYGTSTYETVQNRAYMYILNGWTGPVPDNLIVFTDNGVYDTTWASAVIVNVNPVP